MTDVVAPDVDLHWFEAARLGMFVHWSAISSKGLELSWPLVGGIPVLPYSQDVAVADYYDGLLDFDPDPGSAATWCALARRAGMGYVVLTTKHHDGFALWPSAHAPLSVARGCGRDLVGEYVEAARAEGLQVGFYLSLSDWAHPDYPAFREEDKPYISFLGRRADPEAWDRYLEDLFGQVRELCTGYGPIAYLWFDGHWERAGTEWRAPELRALIRELQPDCLVNDRLDGVGDVTTPEQSVPPQPLPGRWETCLTMNRTWGWHPGDDEYKTARRIVHTICETAGKGGNLLLNVSPTGTGALPQPQVERLEAVARWMEANGAAIHGSGPGLEPWQLYGPSTRVGDRLFLHLLSRPYETVGVRGVHVRRVRRVVHLASGTELAFETATTADQELFGADPVGEVIITVPADLVDDLATVLELDLGG